MAHRIYLYNTDSESGNNIPTYLGEWNYEIPLLLIPLVAQNLKAKGKYLFADKEQGVVQLRYFYNLLADHYQLHYKKNYYEPVNQLFDFLEKLPFDTWEIDGSDVFTMNEEKPKDQAKEWVAQITQTWRLMENAIEKQDLYSLDILLENSGYASFLEILQTDWINYGLGYFETDSFFKVSITTYEENGKLGLQDLQSNRITEAIYSEIFEWNDAGVAVAQKGETFGYMNIQGEEIVPCVYENALDAFELEGRSIGQIWQNNKTTLIDCEQNELLFPFQFEELERAHYHFYNGLNEGVWKIYNIVSKEELPISSSDPFEYDYWSTLFFTKKRGSSLRSYFNEKGAFIGEFVEETLLPISNGYLYNKANKFQQKIAVINQEGVKILEQIDEILVWDNFETFAFRQGKQWFLYNTDTHEILLKEIGIQKVMFNDIRYHFNDLWVLKSENQLGIFDAKNKKWIIELDKSIESIDAFNHSYFLILKDKKHFYFETETQFWSEEFDYLVEDFFTSRNLSEESRVGIAFKNKKLFAILENHSLIEISEINYAEIDVHQYNLRGKDLNYWKSFYQAWKEEKGTDFELTFDAKTIRKLADEYAQNYDYINAIRLYTHLAEQGDTNCMVELGLLYTNENECTDIEKGIEWNEKAADEMNPLAWNNLGYFYQNAIGYEYDMEKMLFAYQKAGELGDAVALANLGDLYFEGNHVTQDYDKALDYYLQAEKKYEYRYAQIAEIFYQKSQFKELIEYLKRDYEETYSLIYYGILYDFGYGVKTNAKKAVSYYEKANKNMVYGYATQRLLYYYGTEGEFANAAKWQKWHDFAIENEVEIDS